MKEVKKTIKVPIYGGRLIIVMTSEDNTYNAAIRHFKVTDDALKECDGVTLRSVDRGGTFPLIFSGNITPGIIAHEAAHTLNAIFKYVGVETTYDSDEHYTYALQWIVNRIWEVKMRFDKLSE